MFVRPRWSPTLVFVSFAALLVAAPETPAATVNLAVDGDETTFSLVAATGERNGLTITRFYDQSAASVTFRDAFTPLTAGPGCQPTAKSGVMCRFRYANRPPSFVLDLGDGDDSVDMQSDAKDFRVDGGPGADAIYTPSGPEGVISIDAGSGDDLIVSRSLYCHARCSIMGGLGDDILRGGDAPEQLDGGGGHDSISGGKGNDLLTDGDQSGAFGRRP